LAQPRHGFAEAIGSEQNDVGAVVEEAEAKQLSNGLPVATLGPAPIEVGDGLNVPMRAARKRRSRLRR
jgi:hypothetical protein